MKYGETLRQRSIPAWSHHNIDYDDIKFYIKEQTTAGRGKTVSVPGRSDDKLQQFESALFAILTEQHQRIGLFVKSKAGEIQRRLDHSRKQLRQLSARTATVAERRVPVSRLERFGRLENDVLKAGDEIKSLARFTSTQRTAFRKLLKKYKKWTGSTQLEDRFREEVLDDPKSFTKLDLGSLLDDYSVTLQEIRTLYETKIQGGPARKPQQDPSPRAGSSVGSSVLPRLQSAVESGSKVEFDTAIATIPLGENGTFASYFVHPENVVELQVLLLQHARYYVSRSRSNSVVSPGSRSPDTESLNACPTGTDYSTLVADDAERFAKEQNSLTIDDREYRTGSTPQKAKLCARWNGDEEAMVVLRSTSGKSEQASIKKKHVKAVFDRGALIKPGKAAASPDAEPLVEGVRREVEKDRNLEPLYTFSSCRSRFVGNDNDQQKMVLATFDTGVTIHKAGRSSAEIDKSSFPFAVLLVRQESAVAGDLLAALDQSHLVERVRGFSMEYHAIWETCQSPNIPAPFWLPVLSRDIRKLPPPAVQLERASSSTVRTPVSRGSVNGIVTDSTTAVETARSDSATQPEELKAPQLRSFRKKRRRAHPQESAAQQQQQKYWSEYDHPEDGSDAGDAYVLFIDPNEKSALDRLFDKLSAVLGRRKPEEEGLLSDPTTPKDDESSSDEEASAPRRHKSYGALPTNQRAVSVSHAAMLKAPSHAPGPSMPHLTSICFVASLVILAMAYILTATSRRKVVYQVDVGVVFAIASSLFFSVVGFISLLRQQDVSYPAWAVGAVVLVVDAVGSGGLLAWMLG